MKFGWNVRSVSNNTLSQDVINDLVFMREEEKLARDVYLTLSEKYNVPVFKNIAKSEQIHMNAISRLLDKYNIEDPVKTNEIGVFTNPELQSLYNELVNLGSQSLEVALKVGLEIEVKDIDDLENAMQDAKDNFDILLVYSHLERGSEHHEAAFNYWLDEIDERDDSIVSDDSTVINEKSLELIS